MKKIIKVNKYCDIIEIEDDYNYILDIYSLTNIGFINFQLGIGIYQDCCESNKLTKIDFKHTTISKKELPDRLKNRYRNIQKNYCSNYIEKIYIKEIELYIEEDECDEGGYLRLTVKLKNNEEFIVKYSNTHNGYYSHLIEVNNDGDNLYYTF